MATARVSGDDPYSLERFTAAQEADYGRALAELRAGRKQSHWMWFVFPQFGGLGSSSTSEHFAIHSLDEARAYLSHPVLGPRLVECSQTLLRLNGPSASDVFPYPDDLKLRSSMTLFERAAPPGSVFAQVLERCLDGERDGRTLDLVEEKRT